MSISVQTCLSCQDTEQRLGREIERLKREVHYLEQEKDEAFQRIQELEYHNRRLERDNYRLRTKTEEPLSKRSAREHAELREWLEAWNEIRLKIPGARPVKDTTLGPEGSYAKLVRKARGVWSHEEMMECIRGAGLSDWWTADLDRFKVSALIGDGKEGGRRDEKIDGHIQRWRDYGRLIAQGFDEQFARRQVQRKRGPVFSASDEFKRALAQPGCCPNCGADGVTYACFCNGKAAA